MITFFGKASRGVIPWLNGNKDSRLPTSLLQLLPITTTMTTSKVMGRKFYALLPNLRVLIGRDAHIVVLLAMER
eukprot:2975295-Pleurochrysis_carterae.AAC.1